MVVMRERTTTLESEQQHQKLLQLTYQRVTMTSILESLAQPLNSYALGRLPCVRRRNNNINFSWRMICALTASGILNKNPRVLSKALESSPTLARFYGRLQSSVTRRVWAERAAVPVSSRYVQALVELLASVKRSVAVSTALPKAFSKFWGVYSVDAATPLPLKTLSQDPSHSNESFWESEDGWVSSNSGWEIWSGSVEYVAVDWKTPSQSSGRGRGSTYAPRRLSRDARSGLG